MTDPSPPRRDLKRRKPRRNAFGAAKQRTFLAALAATCNVEAARRKAQVARSTVYTHRARSAQFRALWAAAVREAYGNLELAMLERSMNGTVKTVTRADGTRDQTHEYPNAVALALLRLHRTEAAEAAESHEAEDVEELRARIAARIKRLRERIQRERGTDGG